jgi:hypothetical protein
VPDLQDQLVGRQEQIDDAAKKPLIATRAARLLQGLLEELQVDTGCLSRGLGAWESPAT